jgi:hypothetical protein
MPLFDNSQRTETRAKRQNEPSFDYLNSSARPSVCAIRNLLNTWYSRFPSGERHALCNRFRKRQDVPHQSAFLELYWHEFLTQSGYLVDVHPVLSGVNKHPDFLATKPGVPPFYLEARLAMPPLDPASEKRLAAVHDTLNRIDSPNFFLHMESEGNATDNINGNALRARLERWLRTLDPEIVAARVVKEGHETLPNMQLSEHGLTLSFLASPKGPELRGEQGIQTIGSTMLGEMRQLNTHKDIRSAIEAKAKKYGELDRPLVIAINVMDIFCEQCDILNALFGEERVVVTRQSDGQWRHDWGTRTPNGAWRGPQGPRNTGVSAVIVTNQLVPWTLRACKVELVHNPWASYPLLTEALPIPQYSVIAGRIHRQQGVQAADILDVPSPWPIEE